MRPEGSICVVFRRSMKTTDLYTGWFTQIPPIGSQVKYLDRFDGRKTAKVMGQVWLLEGNPLEAPVTIVNLIIK